MNLTRALMGELAVCDVIGRDKRRYGRERDGGYVLVEGIPCGVVYSFGVGDDVSFERALANAHGVPVYLYDPTIESPPADARGMAFDRRALAGSMRRAALGPLFGLLEKLVGAARPVISRPELQRALARRRSVGSLPWCLRRNGDLGRRDILLKVDVEGAEFDALFATPHEVLAGCAQIVVEVHELGVPVYATLERQIALFRHLGATHRIVHVHLNNHGVIREIDGLRVPSVLELTWLRRDLEGALGIAFVPSRGGFPTSIDRPNAPHVPDPPLDFWPFAPEA